MLFRSVWSSVTLSCPTLCNSMDCSTPDFPVHHQLPELTQTHVYKVHDAIQPSHPLLSPSPPTFNLSQYQGSFPVSQFFASVAKVLSFSLSISPSNEYSELISNHSSPTPPFNNYILTTHRIISLQIMYILVELCKRV